MNIASPPSLAPRPAPGTVHADARAFRGLLRALSRPGEIVALAGRAEPACPLPPAVAAIAHCLLDFDTPVWLDAVFRVAAVRRYLELACAAPLAEEPGAASFALIGGVDAMPPLEAFRPGEPNDPDRSATLVLCVASLVGGPPVRLVGPGIKTSTTLSPEGLPAWFWPAWDRNSRSFPLGVDILVTDGACVVGLPRTTRRS